MERVEYGEYIVSDPGICHGNLTFKGTRILVRMVLDYVSAGRDWDWIVRAYGNSFPKDAIAEAVELANRALVEQQAMQRAA